VTAPAKPRPARGESGKSTATRAAAPARRRPPPPPNVGERAAAEVLEKHTTTVTLPDGLGVVRIPEPSRLAYYAGLGLLAAFGILDWPVAAALGIGHLLAEDHHHRVLAEFGEALSDA
jgi:hypothetical protein